MRAILDLLQAVGMALDVAATHQLDRHLGGLFGAERDEGVAAVQAAQRVHHQPEVPDGPRLLEQGNQLVFEQVPGNLSNKYLQRKEQECSGDGLSVALEHRPCSPTSVPTVGWGPEYTDSGGGPPYFLWPVVTSRVYLVLSSSSMIFASSGPLVTGETLVPCFSLCRYVFITPQRKALLFWDGHRRRQKVTGPFTWRGVASPRQGTHLDVGQVALLELDQHLQGAVLVELLQGFERPFIEVAVSHQAWRSRKSAIVIINTSRLSYSSTTASPAPH